MELQRLFQSTRRFGQYYEYPPHPTCQIKSRTDFIAPRLSCLSSSTLTSPERLRQEPSTPQQVDDSLASLFLSTVSSDSFEPSAHSTYYYVTVTFTMADVDMTDAPAATTITKRKGATAGDTESIGGKKRFEVKKVNEDFWLDL